MRRKTSCSHRCSCIGPSAASADRFIELAGRNETKRATKFSSGWIRMCDAHKSFVVNSRFMPLPAANIGFIFLRIGRTKKSSLWSLLLKIILTIWIFYTIPPLTFPFNLQPFPYLSRPFCPFHHIPTTPTQPHLPCPALLTLLYHPSLTPLHLLPLRPLSLSLITLLPFFSLPFTTTVFSSLHPHSSSLKLTFPRWGRSMTDSPFFTYPHSTPLIFPTLTSSHYHSHPLTTTHINSLPLTSPHHNSHLLTTTLTPSVPLTPIHYHSHPLTTTHTPSLPLTSLDLPTHTYHHFFFYHLSLLSHLLHPLTFPPGNLKSLKSFK